MRNPKSYIKKSGDKSQGFDLRPPFDLHQKTSQDRYFGSDFYCQAYRRSELDRYKLGSDDLVDFNLERQKLFPKSRAPLEYMEGVAIKTGSIFRPYSKGPTEYFETISKYENPEPYQGHLGKFHGAGLENKVTNIQKLA